MATVSDPVLVCLPLVEYGILTWLTISTRKATGPDALEESLGRLSKKPGVKAAIVLDRASGTILKTTGQVGTIRKPKPTGSSTESPSPAPAAGAFSGEGDASNSNQNQDVGEVAALVWNFVNTAGGLVEELDAEVCCAAENCCDPTRGADLLQDEMRLLRLRTKRQEFVIVPDPKYLLIVVHDTSSA